MELIGFGIVVVFWVAFAGTLLFSRTSLHEAWAWFKTRSLVVQLPLGVVFLPWLIGMWIWESGLPVVARAILVGGLAWANVYAFAP